jgi:hypothetical protein
MDIKLEVGGVYKTNVKDLVEIREINDQTQQLKLYNITESCTQWTSIKKHRLIERIR